MVMIASIMILKTDRPFESHQASGNPIVNSSSVVIPANFKVSHIGVMSIKDLFGHRIYSDGF